mmetsp:Transcript_56489/g.156376  ORF Transcript_56489/g.156376 Transcript_56489/m.156376 type:complete len:196 (-) Transcript_56489:167-754(-)
MRQRAGGAFARVRPADGPAQSKLEGILWHREPTQGEGGTSPGKMVPNEDRAFLTPTTKTCRFHGWLAAWSWCLVRWIGGVVAVMCHGHVNEVCAGEGCECCEPPGRGRPCTRRNRRGVGGCEVGGVVAAGSEEKSKLSSTPGLAEVVADCLGSGTALGWLSSVAQEVGLPVPAALAPRGGKAPRACLLPAPNEQW